MFGDLEKDFQPMSKEEFLKQFPKEVIKEGNIIPIREELEKRFRETQELDVNKLNSNEPIVVETHVTKNEANIATNEIVNLRVRTETGKRTIIVKLHINDKMDKVYQAVKPYM